jgi:aminopeptidase N
MNRRPRLVSAAAGALALALAAGCTHQTLTQIPAPTSTSSPTGATGPGADGIGDSYFPNAGNGGYDVGNYDLDVTYEPASKQLTGIATITATAVATLTSFDLDFTGLKTDSVTVDGTNASTDTAHQGKLVVTPAQPIPTGTAFTTVVRYGGQPQGFNDPQLGGEGFLTTADGAFAVGEPDVAASWFPVNDHPRDKATYTIKITAPSGLAALSNGVLQSKVDSSRAGFTTWTWRESSPMASYLATAVIGTYRVHESTHDGLPVVTAVHTSLSTDIDDELARTPEVIDFLETQFGPYPFDAMGGIAINDSRVRYALENQTRPVYAAGFFSPGRDSSWVLAHELAHQWYGDSVSVHDWSEIWLNEGFATYAEWLWEEHLGESSPQQTFDRIYDTADDQLWTVPPGAPGKDDLFGESVYTRGGLTLQALRVTVGDDAFFRILRQWASSKKDGSATTAEFIALAEQVSGKQLHQLFQDWLYGSKRPARP